MQVEDETIGQLLKTRNAVVHAHPVGHEAIARSGLEVRRLARETMRLELARHGVHFRRSATEDQVPSVSENVVPQHSVL